MYVCSFQIFHKILETDNQLCLCKELAGNIHKYHFLDDTFTVMWVSNLYISEMKLT